MSADERLAEAIGQAVRRRLDAGVGFLRVPEIVSPFPLTDLLECLHDLSDTRYAVFLDGVDTPSSPTTTTHVYEAIRWRNDPTNTDNLVIIGDLERDRAAGLADIPRVTGTEVRGSLIESLTSEAQRKSASAKTIKLLNALKSERLNLQLHHLADYCDALMATLGTSDLEESAANLWRLGLLPDRPPAEQDIRRLRENAATVADLRQTDATSIQRLIRQLSKTNAGNYEAVRLFSSTGNRSHLRTLQLSEVREALRSSAGPTSDESGGEEPKGRSQKDFLAATRSEKIDEAEFLKQFEEWSDDDAAHTVAAGGVDFDWDRVPHADLAGLLEEPSGRITYAHSAGSLESIDQDEPEPLPGKGDVEWYDLLEIRDELRVLEESAPQDSPSSRLDHVIELRESLRPFASDLPREGVRLFMAAPSLADLARELVKAWVDFWSSVELLRQDLVDVGELVELGRKLALTDTRVVVQGSSFNSITAYLLPLHPMVLEPRVRAAAMFLEHPELDQEFFNIVLGALDPSVPSIRLPIQDTPFDLAYSGQVNDLPKYERRAQAFHSPDITRALQDVIDRFLNVHPYSRRSFRVALVDPTADTAKSLLKWLANVDPARRERVALDVYVLRESVEQLASKLAEAQEELVSAEVAGSRFQYSIERLGRMDDLHDLLEKSDRSPHVLCLFDPAEVTQNTTPIANLTPVLGALVNEWEFGARARRDATPYIRPRTGSSLLNEFLTAQARLLGTDSLGTTERTPLLPANVLNTLESVAHDTSWVVVCQGASALVAPPSIGSLELLGRTNSGSHTAFVYSESPALVLEPVLAYLQQHTYLQANVEDLIRFVLGTIRLALPEGLLGFYKRQGILSDESVLGRLGLASVVAFLQDTLVGPNDLVVSLDTEGARKWLGLREGVSRRADLLRFGFSGDVCRIEAIEIKARSGTVTWSGALPEPVVEAIEQARAMKELLQKIFVESSDDNLTASRREILKRQVFLEALHQWEPVRIDDPRRYRSLVGTLNRLFAVDSEQIHVEVVERVFIVTPGDGGGGSEGVVTRDSDGVEIVQLGLAWFRNLLASQPGSTIEIDAELLDAMGLSLDDTDRDEPKPEKESSGPEDADTRDPIISESLTPESSDALATEEVEVEVEVEVESSTDNLADVARRLQASFRARAIPYVTINTEEAIIGPSVIQIPIRLEVGARSGQVESQADDIARDLGVQAFRITNFPGRPGFALVEIPRDIREIPDVTTLQRPDLPYPALAIGAQLNFEPYWECLDNIPHLLVAGKTGSGKSILIRSFLWQLTHLYQPEELDLVLIGPKAADYLDFTEAEHFKAAENAHLRADGALDLLREIVDVRYQRQQTTFDECAREALANGTRVSNLRELLHYYASRRETAPLRPFVVIIDEFVELLESNPRGRKEFETLIARFSRLFRYIGGTMIAATQRPSVKSITGDIKANFRPLALRVERSVDSRVILDEGGAEQLIGLGDLLYKSDAGLVRLQGYAALGTYT